MHGFWLNELDEISTDNEAKCHLPCEEHGVELNKWLWPAALSVSQIRQRRCM